MCVVVGAMHDMPHLSAPCRELFGKFSALTGLAVHASEALVAQTWFGMMPAYAVAVANSVTSHTDCVKVVASEWANTIYKLTT